MSRSDFGRNKKPYDRPRPSDGMWVHDKVQKDVPRSVSNTALNGNVGRGPASVNTKLVVSNLHYNVTPKDLISIFGQIGTLIREPHIKYDRSGRSTGVAYITYETPTEATRAKKQFDGIEAKGQKMSVNYDTTYPGRLRRSSAPESLLDRIQKKPLLERLDTESEKERSTETKASRSDSGHGGGPIRNRERGGRRGGAAGGRGGGRVLRKTPKTAQELDNELDAYLREDTGGDSSVTAATAGSPTAGNSVQENGDVEMA